MKFGNIDYIETVLGSAPEGWSQGYIKLIIEEHPVDRRLIVECWQRGAFGIHEIERERGDQMLKFARLSHVPTGRQIGTFATVDDAALIAEEIEGCTDWSALAAQRSSSDLSQRCYDHFKKRFDRVNVMDGFDGLLIVYLPHAGTDTDVAKKQAGGKLP